MNEPTHIHHIIPKHMGGTDDPSNLIQLTVEEHAEAHRKLYEQYGHLEDKLAWQGLLGLIDSREIMRQLYESRRGSGNPFYGKTHTEEVRRKISRNRKNKGKQPKTSEWKQKMSEKMSGENNPAFGKSAWNRGKKLGPQSAESRRKKGFPLIFRGKEYNSMSEAVKLSGVSAYFIRKECQFLSK